LIGMPFSLEGFAFFLEAIALGIYLYGWDRVSKRVHLASGIVVAISGLLSGVFVVAVNAWMNTPRGFRVAPNGELVDIDLWEAFFTPAFPTQAAHMAVAAYSSVSFAVLGIHAFRLRKRPSSAFHLAAVRLVLPIAIVAAILQLATGDLAAKHLAREQPGKLAAAEALFETRHAAPLTVGGIPDAEARTVHYGIHVPFLLSVLATGDPNGEVRGLDTLPRTDWPPLVPVHTSFEVMIACGSVMLGVALWAGWLLFRKKPLERQREFLWVAAASGPLGLIAVEAGWMVTELGRQPWIVRGVLRTADAVTPMPNLFVSLIVSCLVYLLLGGVVALLLWRYVASTEAS
jgi:cytochrome d ubiquinol oxidase subunit I